VRICVRNIDKKDSVESMTVFKSIGRNGKKITKSDFSSWFTSRLSNLKNYSAIKIVGSTRKAFDSFDEDGSKSLDYDEFIKVWA